MTMKLVEQGDCAGNAGFSLEYHDKRVTVTFRTSEPLAKQFQKITLPVLPVYIIAYVLLYNVFRRE